MHEPPMIILMTSTGRRSSGFTLTHERLANGRAQMRILRAVDRARAFVPLRALLRFLRLSASRFQVWRRLERGCVRPFVNLLIESGRTSRLTDDAGQNIVF